MAAKGSTASRKKKRSGIKINPANQGKMRKTAGAKSGQNIPVSKLRKLKNSKNPTTRKRANFALNAKTKFGKGGKKKKRS